MTFTASSRTQPGAPGPRTAPGAAGEPDPWAVRGSADGVREQGHLACVLDGRGHVALMLGAVAGDPAGTDLAAVAHELAQQVDVLVVDVLLLVSAELAELALGLAREAPALRHSCRTSCAGPASRAGRSPPAQNGGSSLNWPPPVWPPLDWPWLPPPPLQSPPPPPPDPREIRSTLAVANLRLGATSSASTSVAERF